MRIRMIMVAALVTSGVALAQDTVPLDEQMDRVSYSIGMNLGLQFKRDDVKINPEMIARGMKDTLADKSQLTEEEMRSVLQGYQEEHRRQMQEARQKKGEENRLEGEKFLADNKNKPGVIVLPSGLQYEVLEEGEGEPPGPLDIVTVHYQGTLLDGTEFDSSYKREKPSEFAVNRVIRGWTEALRLMNPGSKWKVFIPSDLAYGANGSGRLIGPNATLVFEVELLSFRSPPEKTATPPRTSQTVTSDIIKVPSREELEKGAKIEVIKKEDLERLQREQQQKKDGE